uniref:Meg domain-containing protein n=1 Tax=Oryza punctata TaxID=4537 RepID=A0A0E0JXM0_ORYPU
MKTMQHVDARLLFLLLLVIGCAAIPAVQCRSINGEMLRGKKINIPPGPLCAEHSFLPPIGCKNCWCCEVTDGCYQTLEECQDNCPLPSPP